MAAGRIAIIGGGPAGLATARAYRACGGKGEVILLSEESLLPYERPPLTKGFLRGEIDVEELSIERREWFEEHAVELRLEIVVKAIDPGRGVLTLVDHSELLADAIVLATGSEPIRPDVPGADHEGVVTMRRLPDSQTLSTHAKPGERIAIVGSGFIGCEIAGSLALRGANVTLISAERLPQLERLGEEAAQRIATWLTEMGIELIGSASVAAVHDGHVVELDDGRRLTASRVVLGTGVRPRSELAQAAGLQLRAQAVAVDETMRSLSHPTVLAVGDVAFAYNTAAARALRVEHWGDALTHGEVAGRTLARGDGRWDSVPGFWSTIGEHTLKYAAWGDGHDECRFVQHPGGAFSVWYSRNGALVGVLTHERDGDYGRGRELIAAGEQAPT